MQTPFQVIAPGVGQTRKKRVPNFAIAGALRPYLLYPLWAHPVLPGETVTGFDRKWRVVSKPVKNPLSGAWLETFLFYVKLTDLDRDLGEMFISDSYSTSGHTAGANRDQYFTKAGQIDWIWKCVTRIAESYFSNENETLRVYSGTDLYKVKRKGATWNQNLTFQDTVSNPAIGAGPEEVSGQLRAWQIAQLMSMTEITYEKYLRQYGVQSIDTAKGDPELLRYAPSWTLPVNTVDPANGTPSSAWVWSDEVNMNKARKFTEPGFLIEVACLRPKVYLPFKWSMIGNLWGLTDWFPVYNLQDPTAGVREILASDAVFDGIPGTADSKPMYYDHRDLLSHGEQFINYADAALPYVPYRSAGMDIDKDTAQPEDLRGEYVSDASIDGFFVTGTSPNNRVAYDGMVTLEIQGHIADTTR